MSKLDENIKPDKALIYCRVSSSKQTTDGSGLESQEHRCRQYAAQNGYTVEEVFRDKITGGGDYSKRPGLMAMLAYLDAQPDETYAVIFDDLKRYARDTQFHLKLNNELKKRNVRRECPNFHFEDSAMGELNETVYAAFGQFERLQIAQQTNQKMRARLEQGFWVFQAPVGYRYEKSNRGGKELVRDEPVASIIQEALEGFAAGRFQNQTEVRRYLDQHPDFPKGKAGRVHPQRVKELLERNIYAGFVESPKWGISAREGQHEALISYQTYLKNQERLKDGAYAPARRDISADFPLRGFVECGDCGSPLSACWSTGKTKKHPYYLCHQKGCDSYGKSIRRADMEGQFQKLLSEIEPQPITVELLHRMIRNAWAQRLAQASEWQASLKMQIQGLEKQIDGLLDRLVETTSQAAIKAYERKIDQLEKEKHLKTEKMHKTTPPSGAIDQILELSMQFLSSPCIIWEKGNLHLQKLVLRLVFRDRLAYARNEGFRTPKTTSIFSMLGQITSQEKRMVPGGGIEPPTRGFSIRCSTPELPGHRAEAT